MHIPVRHHCQSTEDTKIKMPRVLLLFCFLAGFTAGQPVPGFCAVRDQSPPELTSVSVGLDGSARVGKWTPVRVTVGGVIPENATVEVVTPDPQGHPVSVSTIAAPETRLFIQPGRTETTIEVRLIAADQVLTSKRISTRPDENGEQDFTVLRHAVPRWIVAGKLPVVDEMSRVSNTESLLSGIHITQLSTDRFPAEPLIFSGYDAVFLSGEFDLSPVQARSLDTWVKRGGQLICFLGSEERVSQFQSSPLADWFEIDIQTKRVSDLSGIEAFVQGKLDDVDSAPLLIGARRVAVASVRIPGSVTLDRGGLSGSVLTEVAHGFGRVTFAGFDMDRRPLSLWGDRGSGTFLRTLTGTFSNHVSTTRRSGRISRSGITDLATQFREAVEFLPDKSERSTLSVLGLILLYLLIIGPVDYLLVHRVLNRPQLTWVTFPAIVVAGALLARSAAQSANGNELQVTQLDVVDIDATTGFFRQHAWCAIYSPENARYRVAVRSTGQLLNPELNSGTEEVTGTVSAEASSRLGWFGMPEENYGGMYRGSGLELGKPGYVFSRDGHGIDNLPIPIWSNRSLRAETQGSIPEKLLEIRFKQSGTGGQLSPDSRFSHRLPDPLQDWLIVYGNRAYFPKDLNSENASIRPGEVWTPLDSSVTSRDVAGYLNGIVFTRISDLHLDDSDRISTTITEYDSQSRNINTILSMISLHELSGGTGYTGLKNHAMRRMELSRHISLNQALLIGRINTPATVLELDGEVVQVTRHDVFVRILLPVEPTRISSVLPSMKED